MAGLSRRGFLAAAAATPVANLLRGANPPAQPNVLILLADDLGTADLNWAGSEIDTPNLNRLATQGVRFEQAYAYPVCSPSRAGLMTGRSPMRFGVQYWIVTSQGVPITEHFMPESFRAAGYQTSIAGKWHLGNRVPGQHPNKRGFDHTYGLMNAAVDYYKHTTGTGRLDWHRDGVPVEEEGYSTDLIAAEVIRSIRQRDRARPFFAYVPFNAVHTPLVAKPELLEKYVRIEDLKRRTFAAMLESLDDACGKILRALDDEGVADNTVALFISDNGGQPAQGSKNAFRGGKGSTWEGGIRVPALMRWPGVLRPGKSAQVLSMLDVFPTLAGATGVTPLNKLPLDGRNLWESIRTGKVQEREDLFFAVDFLPTVQQYAVRRGDWKLVRQTGDGEAKNWLYRLDKDPMEKNDLAASNPALVKELVAAIEKWAALHPPGGDRRPAAGQ